MSSVIELSLSSFSSSLRRVYHEEFHRVSIFVANFPQCKKRKTRIFLVPKRIFMTSGKDEGRSSRATTRKTRKRKTPCDEQRDSLWDVVVKWDDICFKHILPRLNRTDVKILYEVNTETRKLIKRSSRKRELKKKYKVSEMSSVSTLDVALENLSLWSGDWDETEFCAKVALTNKLELLEWAREWIHCDWDSNTMRIAAEQGNLEMVKYCVAKKCPINGWACAEAAGNGHLEVLKYLREEAKAPWNL